jgi:RHS repeat-associated protein
VHHVGTLRRHSRSIAAIGAVTLLVSLAVLGLPVLSEHWSAWADTPPAPAGPGPKQRPLPAAAQPNHGLPKGERPPVVPPGIGTNQPARRVTALPKAPAAAPADDQPAARDLVLRSGFVLGDTSLVLYFDIGGNGAADWASWHATVFDPENNTEQRSVTRSPSDLKACGFPRKYCHSFGSDDGWTLVPGHKYFVTVTGTLTAGNDLDSPPSGQAAARRTVIPPAVQTPQAAGCGCPTALAFSAPLQALRGTGVSTGTGAFHWSALDLSMSSFAVPFIATRYYSSANPTSGLLGRGWSWAYEVRVLPAENGGTDALVRAEDGAQVAFTRNSDGSYASPPGVRSKLALTPDGWRLTTPAQIQYAFDNGGRLLSIKNKRGFGVTIDYGGVGWRITDAAGRHAIVLLDGAGRLSSVTIADGRTVRYGYTDGQLTSVVDAAGNRWTYAYTDGLLTKVIDPRGIAQSTNEYAGSRVVAQRDANGALTRFEWDATKQETKTTDPDGVLVYDGYRGNVLVYSQNGNGDVDNVRYDEVLDNTLSVDPKGNQYERGFDVAGNQTASLAPEPFSFTERRSYDAANNLIGYTDGEGNQGAYSYSANNELEQSTDPNGDQTKYRYDDRGLLVEVTDPLDRVTRYAYDKDGNRVTKTAPTGATTRFGYDAVGRMTSRTDPRGQEPGAEVGKFTTRYGYDALDHMVAVQSPGKRRPAIKSYDAVGQLVATTDPLGRTTKYLYDKVLDRQVKVVAPVDRVTTTQYTNAGRRSSLSDPDGNLTTYTYDNRGYLATVVSPRGNLPGADRAAFTTTYFYDFNGNLLRSTRPYPGGGTVLVDSSVDELDRVFAVTDPLGNSAKSTLDNTDRVVSSVDPLGAETRIHYDANGRPTAVTAPGGGSLDVKFDKAGNMIRRVSPGGGVTTWTYDGENRPLTMTEPRGNVAGADPKHFTTSYRYDAAGNLVEVTDPLGHAQRFSYDENGRVVSSTDQNGNTRRFEYDDGDELVQVSEPDSGGTRYSYNDDGTVALRFDREGHHYRYGYDKLRQLTSVKDPMQHERRFGYDAEGNLVRIVADGKGDEATRSVIDSYDSLNRRVRRSLGTNGPVYNYGHDGDNRLTSVADPAGVETMDYDKKGRLTKVTRGGQTYGYGYDDASNVTRRERPDGSVLDSSFDKANRLVSLQVSGGPAGAGATYGFAYDASDRLTQTTYPSATGLVTDRRYDEAGRTIELNTHPGTGDPLARYQVTRDAVGNPTLITTTRGAATQRTAYAYDSANRILAACYGVPSGGVGNTPSHGRDPLCPDSTAGSERFSYDTVGNRLTERRTGTMGDSTTKYVYDPANRLHLANTHGPDHVLRQFDYDDEGNLVRDGDNTYEYNLDHTLAAATVDGKTTRFGYDGRGLRISATGAGGSTRNWSWDVNGVFADLAVETTGAQTRGFVPAPVHGPLALLSGGTQSYVPDWLGGVAGVVSPTGTTLEQNDYDSYGSIRTNGTAGAASGQGTDNPLLFAGMYQDPTLAGQYGLPLRTYDPTTGRLAGVEPEASSIRDPTTSTYVYALDRPTALLDPTGGMPVPDGGGGEPPKPDPRIPNLQQWDKYPWELPCTASPAQYCQILLYIYDEMKRNAKSDKVRDIKGELDYYRDPPWTWIFAPDSRNGALLGAMEMWALTVCQGCQWDHKPKIREKFNMTLSDLDSLYSDVPATRFRIFYDVWSNIHYGYVGVQATIDDKSLQQGPSMGLPGTGTNDTGDVISTQIGIDLGHAIKPDDLTPDNIDYAIRAKLEDYYAAKDSKTVILRK